MSIDRIQHLYNWIVLFFIFWMIIASFIIILALSRIEGKLDEYHPPKVERIEVAP